MTERFDLKTFAGAIAAELPGAWTVDPIGDIADDTRYYLTRKDGLQLFLSYDGWNNKGRISCSPSVPRYDGGYNSLRCYGAIAYGESPPSCTADPARPVKRIAGEIRRKVLEPYEPMLVKIRQTIAEWDAEADKAKATWRQLSEILGTSLADDNRSGRKDDRNVYLYEGRAGVSGKIVCRPYGSVDVELRSIRADQAIAIAKALVELNA